MSEEYQKCIDYQHVLHCSFDISKRWTPSATKHLLAVLYSMIPDVQSAVNGRLFEGVSKRGRSWWAQNQSPASPSLRVWGYLGCGSLIRHPLLTSFIRRSNLWPTESASSHHGKRQQMKSVRGMQFAIFTNIISNQQPELHPATYASKFQVPSPVQVS